MRVFRDPGVISGFRYEPALDGVPAVSHCGEGLCGRHLRVPPHAHRAFEFTYLVHGRVSWQVGGRVYRQGAGEIFVAHPGQSHRMADEPHPEFHQFWIGIDVAAIPEFGPAAARRIRALPSPLIPNAGEAEGPLRGIVRQVIRQEPHCEAVVMAHVAAFLRVVEQRLLIQESPAAGSPAPHHSYPVEKAVAFMSRHLTGRLTLREIAHVSGAGISKLSDAFRREIGLSPYAYHLRQRLDAARKALLRPDATMTQVAAEYGFSSSQHFSTAFRRLFRECPRRWQQKSVRAR
jgi:AraC-like DNA-binding protein